MPTTAHFTTGALAELLDAQLVGPPDLTLNALETIDRAQPGALTFIRSREYARGWHASRASAALVSHGVEVPGHDPAARALLYVPDADLALIKILEAIAPRPDPTPPGVHPTAIVDPTATLGQGVVVGPHCVVGPRSTIGDGTTLGPGVTIGADVRLGRACTLHPRVTILDRCSLGDGCILWPGVVIGADGFGYRPAPDGRGVVKIPHVGTVEIGRGVEIGANTCIDRAKFGATRIGDGTKIDNLVQIGHGCQIGRACLIAGQVGLAGSVVLGDGVMLGGQSGVADNLTVGSGVKVAAKSGILSDIPPGEAWFGYPALPHKQFIRMQIALRRLGEATRQHSPSSPPSP